MDTSKRTLSVAAFAGLVVHLLGLDELQQLFQAAKRRRHALNVLYTPQARHDPVSDSLTTLIDCKHIQMG